MAELQAKIPNGPLAGKWTNYKDHQNLVNPTTKRKLDIIVVGTGLAGASAWAPATRDRRTNWGLGGSDRQRDDNAGNITVLSRLGSRQRAGSAC